MYLTGEQHDLKNILHCTVEPYESSRRAERERGRKFKARIRRRNMKQPLYYWKRSRQYTQLKSILLLNSTVDSTCTSMSHIQCTCTNGTMNQMCTYNV